MLRLPGPVERIFIDWLDEHFPNRKQKILRRLRSLRGGELNDSQFGRRMRGEGIWADMLSQLFRTTRDRLEMHGTDRPLSTDQFRRLPGGQQGLFDTA